MEFNPNVELGVRILHHHFNTIKYSLYTNDYSVTLLVYLSILRMKMGTDHFISVHTGSAEVIFLRYS